MGQSDKWYRQRILVVSKQTQSSFVQAIWAGAWMQVYPREVDIFFPPAGLVQFYAPLMVNCWASVSVVVAGTQTLPIPGDSWVCSWRW